MKAKVEESFAMEIVAHETNGIAVIQLKGRFDAHEVAEVRKALTVTPTQKRLLVNLAQVTFIDSSALACLVQTMKHCREAEGDLYLCELAQPLRVIFELTRLDKAFEIFEAEEAAVQAFAK